MKPIQAQIDAIKLAQLGSDHEYREALHDAQLMLEAISETEFPKFLDLMEQMKEALESDSKDKIIAALEKYNTLFKK